MLAWDVVVLNGYLVLNLAMPMYITAPSYQGDSRTCRYYFPFVLMAMFWAISIHTVTAFLFSSNAARPFWNISLLAPRFIASALSAGPALMIRRVAADPAVYRLPGEAERHRYAGADHGGGPADQSVFSCAEFFTDFYNETSHAASMHYLFFGLDGFAALRPLIWTALALNVFAVIILMIHPLRKNMLTLSIACVCAAIGIWLEKGMGFVVPGFIPTPLGEVFEYAPTATEIYIAMGIWAVGLIIFTLLAKASIAVELGTVHDKQPVPSSIRDDDPLENTVTAN